MRLLDRLLVIGKLDETVVRPIDDLDMLFRQFISKGPAHASIDGLIDFFVARKYKGHIKDFHSRHHRRPATHRIKAHIDTACHDGIVHALVVIELPCRIGRNRHLAMGLFLHLLDKGFDTLCQGMVRWQMIGKLVLDLAALTACGCFLFAAPRKGCHQDRQTGCRHHFHHLPRFHRFPPCSTLARPLYTVSIVAT